VYDFLLIDAELLSLDLFGRADGDDPLRHKRDVQLEQTQ
jgi:hypothetical protein